MDLSKKTLHKLHSRRQFIENTNNRLQKAENKYLHYQNRKEHIYDIKEPNILKKAYNKATKPYEFHLIHHPISIISHKKNY